MVLASALPLSSTAASEPPAGTDDPAAALAFDERFDGRCYNLSAGGKLVVMTNRDPGRAIRYRLRRLFAGRPQGGRSIGTIAAGEERKLGCNRVDGRPQHWEVERAQWDEHTETTP